MKSKKVHAFLDPKFSSNWNHRINIAISDYKESSLIEKKIILFEESKQMPIFAFFCFIPLLAFYY
jgi:hypothetical protein